ncbi:FadR/GntR family transcriptional regulator [Leucobacter chinensis]|uniref:FadR/GntR family transcriptional regulator n=1 Tax=Leucobacter chinensis TaxID=2851010 RepID=UPI001C2234EE|nr:FCD domain-containing protein [Leucobacter chinensis]
MTEVEPTPQDIFSDPVMGGLLAKLKNMQLGEKIPSERLLSEEFGVSRATLRERMGKLESLGVLERRDRSGTFYTGIKAETVSDVVFLGLMSSEMSIESLISFRHALERQAAVEACRAKDHMNIARMLVALEQMDAVDDPQALKAADLEFHDALIASSQSNVLIFFAKVMHVVMVKTIEYDALDDDVVTMRRVHRDICDAIVAQDEARASQVVDVHFAWLDQQVRKLSATTLL